MTPFLAIIVISCLAVVLVVLYGYRIPLYSYSRRKDSNEQTIRVACALAGVLITFLELKIFAKAHLRRSFEVLTLIQFVGVWVFFLRTSAIDKKRANAENKDALENKAS